MLQWKEGADCRVARFVENVGDALDARILSGLCYILDQAVLADLEGDGGQHDRGAVATAFLYHMARTHHERTAAGMVGAAGAGLAENQRPGREIGGRDDPDEVDRKSGG